VYIDVETTRKDYPLQLCSVGDHIRKTRLDRGLSQNEVASIIGVSDCSVYNWENNRGESEIRFIPAIIEFLGYNPRPCPTDTLARLEWYRWSHGLSVERLGVAMGRDPEQLSDWFSGRHVPFRKSLERIEAFLENKLSQG